jgi:hypothetical protein
VRHSSHVISVFFSNHLLNPAILRFTYREGMQDCTDLLALETKSCLRNQKSKSVDNCGRPIDGERYFRSVVLLSDPQLTFHRYLPITAHKQLLNSREEGHVYIPRLVEKK